MVGPPQGALDLGDLSDVPTAANGDAPGDEFRQQSARHPGRRNVGALLWHLPRYERVIEPDCTICPCCSGALHRIGEDVSEALDVVQTVLCVIRKIHPKYAQPALRQRSGSSRCPAESDERWHGVDRSGVACLRGEVRLVATGRKIRILTVVDTFTRFSPAVDPRFSYRGEDVVQTLERICRSVGYPKAIRVDNGSDSSAGILICGPIRKTSCSTSLGPASRPTTGSSKALTASSAPSA